MMRISRRQTIGKVELYIGQETFGVMYSNKLSKALWYGIGVSLAMAMVNVNQTNWLLLSNYTNYTCINYGSVKPLFTETVGKLLLFFSYKRKAVLSV